MDFTHRLLWPGGFTVLMAVYKNDNPFLFRKAIESVIANTLLPNQFIIVIDGPLSSELNIVIRDFSSSSIIKIDFISLPHNIGLASALNKAIPFIKYPWVVRADSDDINLPHRFLSQAKFIIDNPNIDLFGSQILELNNNTMVHKNKYVPLSQPDIFKFLKFRNPFNHMTICIRLNVLILSGGYPNIYLREDYGLWSIVLSLTQNVANMKDILVHVNSIDLVSRRGGLKYAFGELDLQKLLISTRHISFLNGLANLIQRFTFFILPLKIRTFIYNNLLRS